MHILQRWAEDKKVSVIALKARLVIHWYRSRQFCFIFNLQFYVVFPIGGWVKISLVLKVFSCCNVLFPQFLQLHFLQFLNILYKRIILIPEALPSKLHVPNLTELIRCLEDQEIDHGRLSWCKNKRPLLFLAIGRGWGAAQATGRGRDDSPQQLRHGIQPMTSA